MSRPRPALPVPTVPPALSTPAGEHASPGGGPEEPYPTTGRRPGTGARLMLPALAAWCVAAVLLGVGDRHRSAILFVALLTALAALPSLVAGRRRPLGLGATVAAVALTAAASAVCTVLHTADLHRGPLPALARAPAASPVGVELTLTGDPRHHTARSRGSGPGRSLLSVEATADRVTVPAPPESFTGASPPPPPVGTRIHTPVTVLVPAHEAAPWEDLLPSTRIAVDVRVLPAAGGGPGPGGVLLAAGPPHELAGASWGQRLAGRLRSGLRAACAGLSVDGRALLPGLVVGDVSAMPDALEEAFRSTDLLHLTSVSGANLAVLLVVLFGAPGRAGTAERGGLLGLLGVPLRLAALLGAVLTLAFVTLCRPEPSVLRAAATGVIGLLALATGRPRAALPALAGGVLVLLLADPLLARSYGFLFSVLATTGLLTLGQRWAAALRERGWPHHLASGVAAAAAAQALCAPATVLLAPRLSLVGVPCNLLAELAVTPATLLGFAALAAAPVSAAGARVLAGLGDLPAQWIGSVARHGAALPGAEIAWTPGWPGTVLLALAVVAACLAAPLLLPARALPRTSATAACAAPPAGAAGRACACAPTAASSGAASCGAASCGAASCGARDDAPAVPGPADGRAAVAGRPAPAPPGAGSPPRVARRWLRILLPGLLALLLLVVLLRPPLLVRIATGWPPAGWRFVMCSVGQGDLLVLPVGGGPSAAPDTAVVVDAGPDPAAADRCLRDLGVTRIALVILTHFHADHAEGLPGVLRHRAVGAIETTTVGSPPGEEARVRGWAAASGVPLLRASAGEHRTAGPALTWDVLWPPAASAAEPVGANNASVSLLVTTGGLRLALLGDLEAPAQAELLDSVHPGPVDVLKVAHHGSANQDWALAAALRPRLALVSVGTGNSYGHPAGRTVQHLRALGATVLRTDRSGDIAVLGDDPAHLRVLTHPHPDTDEEPAAGTEPESAAGTEPEPDPEAEAGSGPQGGTGSPARSERPPPPAPGPTSARAPRQRLAAAAGRAPPTVPRSGQPSSRQPSWSARKVSISASTAGLHPATGASTTTSHWASSASSSPARASRTSSNGPSSGRRSASSSATASAASRSASTSSCRSLVKGASSCTSSITAPFSPPAGASVAPRHRAPRHGPPAHRSAPPRGHSSPGDAVGGPWDAGTRWPGRVHPMTCSPR
ncbi:hypothetical protein GCM10009665_02860 [Kitasatospora nipponensis]|uniref:Competence protein ComEC n=1 Tax=Kitasatospora nipponensis TaxID=258049 RepID=A0ABN1VQX3_9ACTN